MPSPSQTALFSLLFLVPFAYSSIKCNKSVLRDGRILYNGGIETCDVCSKFTVRTPGQTPVYIAACDTVCREQGTIPSTYWKVENFPKDLDFSLRYLPFGIYNFQVDSSCCSRDNCNDLASGRPAQATAPSYPSYRSYPERSAGLIFSLSSIVIVLYCYFL